MATNLQTCEGKESCKKKLIHLEDNTALLDSPFKEKEES
jgi:hypothetical protein